MKAVRRHADDEWADEIRIRVRPRFKASGLSGDEWRVSAVIEFFRKGRLVGEDSGLPSMRAAAMALPWLWMVVPERPGFRRLPDEDELKTCQQPGCQDPAAVQYRVLQVRCCRQTLRMEPPVPEMWTAFCLKHSRRGDLDPEDCDANLVRDFRAASRGKS